LVVGIFVQPFIVRW